MDHLEKGPQTELQRISSPRELLGLKNPLKEGLSPFPELERKRDDSNFIL
jgi:hypothetical protein